MVKKKLKSIELLKCIAALMVLNSHLESVYPIAALATGGALANGVFFIVSGYLLGGFDKPFKKWYPSRLSRLWIGILLISIFQVLIGYTPINNMSDVFDTFVIPKIFWFAVALAVFYPLLFVFKKNHMMNQKGFRVVSLSILCVYIIAYLFLDTSVWVVETKRLDSFEGLFKLIYYFYIMYLGLYIKTNNINARKPLYLASIAVISFVSLYVVKAVMVKVPVLMHLQFLNQVSVLGFSVAVLLLVLSQEKTIKSFLSNNLLDQFVNWISKVTWEIYLVQFMVINMFHGYKFPVNLFLILLFITLASYILNVMSQWLYKQINH